MRGPASGWSAKSSMRTSATSSPANIGNCCLVPDRSRHPADDKHHDRKPRNAGDDEERNLERHGQADRHHAADRHGDEAIEDEKDHNGDHADEFALPNGHGGSPIRLYPWAQGPAAFRALRAGRLGAMPLVCVKGLTRPTTLL